MTEHRSELGFGKRVIIIVICAIALFVILAIIGIVAALAGINNSTSDTQARLVLLEERADSRRADIEALVEQIKSLGAKPVVDVEEMKEEEKEEEATVPPPIISTNGIKESDVRRIVLEELNDVDLSDSQVTEIARLASSFIIPTPGPRGETGQPGQPGETPTQEQLRELILQAVENVCSDNACDGPQGEAGSDGEQGIQGEQGEIGAQGEQGIPGPSGEIGPRGEQGIPGEKGDKGDTGESGSKGDKGEKGDPGEDTFPFTFQFTIEDMVGRSQTVTCTIKGPNDYECNSERP